MESPIPLDSLILSAAYNQNYRLPQLCGAGSDTIAVMAAMLFCKRMISRRPKLCRSIMGQEPGRPKLIESKILWVFEANEWSKKKNPWEDDIITEESQSFLTHNSESTTKLEDQGIQCPIAFKFVRIDSRKRSDPFFIRIVKFDHGPQADEDAFRTHSYNEFLRSSFSITECARVIARSFLTNMLLHGAIPDLATFQILIRCYCKHLKYESILDVVYTQMKAYGIKADDLFYKILIYEVCVRFGPNVGYELLKEFRSGNGIQMSLSCYDAVVRQFCKGKTEATMMPVLIDVLMDMKQQRLFPDNKIYFGLKKGLRYHGGESFLKAAGIGRQMFVQGMKIGVLSNIVLKKRPGKIICFKYEN